MSKVVWILGAGFSKPLGGPLLKDLLSSRSLVAVQAAYPGQLLEHGHGDLVNRIRGLLRDHGWEGKNGSPAWADAEEFLEHLDDAAARNETAAAVLKRLAMEGHGFTRELPPLDDLAAMTKRLVAADCCRFLKEANPQSEKWQPYRRWVGDLQPTDTVITFNYDRVVELAAEAVKAGLEVVAPGQMDVEPGIPRLLKLHGSVDWKFTGSDWETGQNPEHAVFCPVGSENSSRSLSGNSCRSPRETESSGNTAARGKKRPGRGKGCST